MTVELNRTALLTLADRIEQAGRFNLRIFGPFDGQRLLNDCGTAGCVAGWQNAIMGRNDLPNYGAARQDLGLTLNQAVELFSPLGDTIWGKNPYRAKHRRAAVLLRHIANGTRTFTCDRPTR